MFTFRAYLNKTFICKVPILKLKYTLLIFHILYTIIIILITIYYIISHIVAKIRNYSYNNCIVIYDDLLFLILVSLI